MNDYPKELISTEDHDHEGKCPSISKIHEEYLDGVFARFIVLSRELEAAKFQNVFGHLSELSYWIDTYWSKNVLCLQDQLNCQSSLKVSCGIGETRKSVSQLVSTVGLYADTIIVTDPIQVATRIALGFDPRQPDSANLSLSLVLPAMINLINSFDLLTSELLPPICVLFPEQFNETDITRNLINCQVENDAVQIFSRLLNKRLDSYEVLRYQMKRIRTNDDLDKRIVNMDLWRHLLDATAKIPSEFSSHLNKVYSTLPSVTPIQHQRDRATLGQQMLFHFTGQLTQLNELAVKSVQTSSHPMFSSPEQWNLWLTRKSFLEERAVTADFDKASILNVLNQSKSRQVNLLTSFTNEELIFLRKEGALSDLRLKLFSEICRLGISNSSNEVRVESEISKRVNELIEEHSKQVTALASAERKFYGIDVGAAIARASFAIAALASDDPIVKIVSASIGVSGLGSVKDVIKAAKGLAGQKRALKNSASAILVRKLDQP